MSKPRRRKQKKQVKPSSSLGSLPLPSFPTGLPPNTPPADLPALYGRHGCRCLYACRCRAHDRGLWRRSRAPVTLRANTLKATAEDIAAALDAAGIAHRSVAWYPDAFILPEAQVSDLWDLDIYRDGKIYLQSLSSMMPPLVLGAQAGEDILDMCAAPGGKTTQIAASRRGRRTLPPAR